jgi:hypothetical protein
MFSRRSDARRGAESKGFAPRIEFPPSARGRCIFITFGRARSSVPWAVLSAKSCAAMPDEIPENSRRIAPRAACRGPKLAPPTRAQNGLSIHPAITSHQSSIIHQQFFRWAFSMVSVGNPADLADLAILSKSSKRRRRSHDEPVPSRKSGLSGPLPAKITQSYQSGAHPCSNLPHRGNLARRHCCRAPHSRRMHTRPTSLRTNVYVNLIFSVAHFQRVWHALCTSLLPLVRGLAEVAQRLSQVKGSYIEVRRFRRKAVNNANAKRNLSVRLAPCRLLWWGEFQWLP